jgi:hypothetical protein
MTTFRKDTRDGLYTLLTGFQSANPTMLTHTYRRRPGSFSDRISAFVGSLPETAPSNTLLSQRNITPSVVFVMKLTEPSHEQSDEMDLVVDAFYTYANARPHAISNQTVCVPRSVEDVELEAEGTFYPAAVVTFDTIALEGRGYDP